MQRWYLQAEEELERDLQKSLITTKEYNAGIRDINLELEEYAREHAMQEYNKYAEIY
jgi:hypothetical protein